MARFTIFNRWLAITEEEFPGYGEIITQIWRIKQLEYTWLRSLMRRYEDFSAITRDSLCYTLRCLGLNTNPAVFDRIMEKYLHLDLYPRCQRTLAAMMDRKLAILSNGSTDMLTRWCATAGSIACWTRPSASIPNASSSQVRKPTP